jgi:hypothetical protein
MPWHEKKEVFHKSPLKSEDSVASHHGICENLNFKRSYPPERNRVCGRSSRQHCLEKEHENSAILLG